MAISVMRTAKLEKPFGLGEGRISIGTLGRNWSTASRTIPAATFGLRTLQALILTPGTAGEYVIRTTVRSPGSYGNTAIISAKRIQRALVRVGTPRFHSFGEAFSGTPSVVLGPGSPIRAANQATPAFLLQIQSISSGSFQSRGTQTRSNVNYMAMGPASFGLHYIALGN